MNRRTLLASLGALAGGSLAGCLGSGPPGTDPSPTTDSPSTTGPDSPTTTEPDETPFPTETADSIGDPDTSLVVTSRNCGNGENRASISFEDDTVRIDGVIGGSDTCDTAHLVDARIDDGTLVVRVAARHEEGTGTMACGQCLTDIEYRVTARFEGGLPDAVRVVHESGGETVTAGRKTR